MMKVRKIPFYLLTLTTLSACEGRRSAGPVPGPGPGATAPVAPIEPPAAAGRDSIRHPGREMAERRLSAEGDAFSISGPPADTLRNLIDAQSCFPVPQPANARELAGHLALLPPDTLVHGLNQTGESPAQAVLFESLARRIPWTADAAAFKKAAMGIHGGNTRHRFMVSYFTVNLPQHPKSMLRRMGIAEELNPQPRNPLWTHQFVADTMLRVPLPRFEEIWRCLEAIPDFRLRGVATQALFGNKYQKDPEAASVWLNSQPHGEGRHLATLYLIEELEMRKNNADAAAWRESLKDMPAEEG